MNKYRIALIFFVFFIAISAVNDNTDRYFEIVKNIEIFSNVYKELNTNYVDDLDPAKMMKTAIDAMVNTLDPYTNYISESQIESYRISSEGNYNGLGAQSRMIDGLVTITEIHEGGKAMNAGLKAGDQILSINGNSTEGRSNEDVIEFLRGFPGSEVALAVNRPGIGKKSFTIERGDVNIPNVPFSGDVGENIGYIALTTFTPRAGQHVSDALKNLRRSNENLKGIILDLRGNGGGLLMEAINVCNVFIPRGMEVVTTKGKVKEKDNAFKTRNDPTDLDIPLVVLINKRSASASEIVSGVIQDYDRGVLMGQRSYGKGLVQNTLEIGYNSRLKVTISKYYIPSGRCIQGVEYENGEPKDIPDDQRTKFFTQKGRPVLDGGGVTPDVKIPEVKQPGVLSTLEKDNWIFKYVTDYCQKRDSIESVETYQFDHFSEFKEYLKENNFSFRYETEQVLENVIQKMKQDNLESDVANQVDQIVAKLDEIKKDDLDEYKDLIVHSIEQEIVSRYYFQEGKVRHRLRKDPEIVEAVKLLNESAEYQKLLSSQ